MSTLGGPNNVRDGLVLYIDAANNKCFRGEPTVNLINNPMPTGTTNFVVGGGVGTATYEAAEKAVRWVRTSYETWGAYYYNDSLANYLFDTGSTYAISFEWKYGPTHNAGSTHYFDIIQGNGSNRIIGNFNLLTSSTLKSDGWYYFSKTGIPANAGITQTGQPAQFRLICGNITGKTTDIYWRELQFEKKSYSTPFVDGTRGTTVATGGGLIDLSKNSNNGELVNGPYYSSANSGSLIFDGADDYISINSPSDKFAWTPSGSGNNSMTLDLWVKSTDTSGYYISKPWNGSGEYNYYIKDSEFQIVIGYGAGHTLYRTFSSMATGKWENVTVVFTPTQTGIYRNGVIDAPLSNHGIIYNTPDNGNTNLDLCLMTLYPYETSFDYPTFSMSGNLSTFKIYNKSLSASEVLQNYNATKSRFGL